MLSAVTFRLYCVAEDDTQAPAGLEEDRLLEVGAMSQH